MWHSYLISLVSVNSPNGLKTLGKFKNYNLLLTCLLKLRIFFYYFSKVPNEKQMQMSALHISARTELLALTNPVITSATVWLHLKVMNTKGEGKANIIHFKKHFCHLSELISVFKQHYQSFIFLKSASKVTNQLSLRQKLQ